MFLLPKFPSSPLSPRLFHSSAACFLKPPPSLKTPPPQQEQRQYGSEKTEVIVTEDQGNMRFDRFVSTTFSFSQGLFQKLLRQKEILLIPQGSDSPTKKPDGQSRLSPGDRVLAPTKFVATEKPKPTIKPEMAEMILKRILYKDDEILMIDKPHGLAVQGGSKVGLHLDDLSEVLQLEKPEPPRLAHRLDKDTSGILIYGRTRLATSKIARMFLSRTQIEKEYLAVLTKRPKAPQGRIILPIPKKVPANPQLSRIFESLNDEPDQFQEAFTEYEVLHPFAREGALVVFRPETGRKHQIRIHAAHALRAPILGDVKYGPEGTGVPVAYQEYLGTQTLPMHLHLRQIRLKNWKGKGEDLVVTSPPPPHIKATVLKIAGVKI